MFSASACLLGKGYEQQIDNIAAAESNCIHQLDTVQ